LAAFDLGAFDAAVVAPFAGVVHVGLALLDQRAVADEAVVILHIGGGGVGGFDPGLVALRPFDLDTLFREQTFVIGYEFGQTLARGTGFEDEFLYGGVRLMGMRDCERHNSTNRPRELPLAHPVSAYE